MRRKFHTLSRAAKALAFARMHEARIGTQIIRQQPLKSWADRMNEKCDVEKTYTALSLLPVILALISLYFYHNDLIDGLTKLAAR